MYSFLGFIISHGLPKSRGMDSWFEFNKNKFQILVVGESKVPRFQAYDYTGVLWFNDQQRLSWVEVEMAVIAPGTLYLTVFHGIEVLQVLWHQNMRRQQRFSNKCNMKAWTQTNSYLFMFLMHLLTYKHLKRTSMFINRWFKLVVSLMCLWELALLTCMPKVGVWRMLWECSWRSPHVMWCLGLPSYWDMWNVDKNRRHCNYFNEWSRRFAAKPCYFCESPECLCQCRSSWRGQACS